MGLIRIYKNCIIVGDGVKIYCAWWRRGLPCETGDRLAPAQGGRPARSQGWFGKPRARLGWPARETAFNFFLHFGLLSLVPARLHSQPCMSTRPDPFSLSLFFSFVCFSLLDSCPCPWGWVPSLAFARLPFIYIYIFILLHLYCSKDHEMLLPHLYLYLS